MRFMSLLACVVSCLVICSSASAALATNKGIYLEGNVGYGGIIASRDFYGANGLTGNVAAGYKFNSYFALEAGFGMASNTGTHCYGDLAIKGIMPLYDGLSLFGKLGVATWIDEDDYNKPVALVGAGVGYSFTPNLAVTLQGVYTTKHSYYVPQTVAGTVGLTYIFPMHNA